MRCSRVATASDSQCRSRNCPGFDPSIFQHSEICGAADEAVLNKVHTEKITLIHKCQQRIQRGFVTNSRWRCVFSQLAWLPVSPSHLSWHANYLCLSACHHPVPQGIFEYRMGRGHRPKIIHIEENSETNLIVSLHERPCFLSAMYCRQWLNGTGLSLKHQRVLKYYSRKICGFSSIGIIYQPEGVAWVNEAKDLWLIGFC
jgi:hypothetical protein